MKEKHPLVIRGRQGATAESNLQSMDIIRKLPQDKRKQAIDDLVESNIPLVLLKVDSYIGLHPHMEFLKEDLISVGLIGLIPAINSLAEKDSPNDGGNVNGFIGQRIIWELCRLVDIDERQQVPIGYTPPNTHVVVDPMEIVDTRDLLESICQTPEEQIILNMLEQGCTNEAIANRLSISQSAVRIHRLELEARYFRKLNRDDKEDNS